METRPEQLSNFVRRLWAFCSVGCALGSLAYAAYGSAAEAMVIAVAGLTFWVLSETDYSDLDKLA